MSTYKHGQYFPILLDSIQAGVAYPFNSYLYLKTNKRIVLLVRKNESFSEERLKKLKEFQIGKLYVSETEKKDYHDFLRAFFQTPQGKAIVKEIKENPKAAEAKAADIPEEIAKELEIPVVAADQSISDESEKTEEASSSTPPVAVAPAKVEPPAQTAVAAEKPEEEVKTTVEAAPEDPNEIQVIQLLRQSADELATKIKARSAMSEDDRKAIRGATDKISDEITKVQGLAEKDPSQFKQLVKGCRETINSEIIRVKSIAQQLKDPQQKQAVEAMVQGLENQLQDLEKAGAAPAPTPEVIQKIKGATERIKDEIWKVKSLVSADKKEMEAELVSDSVVSIVKKVESLLGIKLKIADPSEPIVQTVTAPTAAQEPVVRSALQSQAQAIQDLQGTISQQQATTAQAVQKFSGFVSQIQNRINAQEAAVAQEFELFLKGLGQSQEVSRKAVENIVVSQMDIESSFGVSGSGGGGAGGGPKSHTTVVKGGTGIDQKGQAQSNHLQLKRVTSPQEEQKKGASKADPALLATAPPTTPGAPSTAAATPALASEAPTTESSVEQAAAAVAATAVPSAEASAASAAPPAPGSAEELPVLRAQLDDAQSLLKKYQAKMSEISSVMEKSGEYSQALEKEVEETKKQNILLSQKLEQSEQVNSHAAGNLVDQEKANSRKEEEIKLQNERMNELRTQLEIAQKEVTALRGNFVHEKIEEGLVNQDPEKLPFPGKAIALVKEKDTIIHQLQRKLEAKQQETLAIKKEMISMTGNFQNANQLKKEMALRVDKLLAERDAMRQNELSVNRKAQMSVNLLDKARKTIANLTNMTEDLKKERIEYMSKTNEAMKDFKEAQSKTNSLSNHVQAEIQKSQRMAQQNEVLQRKQKELIEKAAQAERKAAQAEADLKLAKKAAQNQNNAADSAALNEAQQKIEKLREENRQITSQFAGEQRKVAELQRALKEAKIKSDKAA